MFFSQDKKWSEKKIASSLYEREASTRQNQVCNGDCAQCSQVQSLCGKLLIKIIFMVIIIIIITVIN